ncbi:phosphopantetheine-binding protein [Bacillus cereus]|nr:phosphopantetheine-binding protein [Bacillus cereus]
MVKEILECNDELSIGDNLGELGLDSLNTVTLIVELEEQFNITFEDEELLFDNFSTLEKICTITERKINNIK